MRGGFAALGAAALLLAGGAGCGDPPGGGPGSVPLNLVDVEYGRFLEELPELAESPTGPRRVLGAASVEGFEPEPRRILVRSGRAGGTAIRATLFAGLVGEGTRFHFACPLGRDARLRWWLFTGDDPVPGAAVELSGAGPTLRFEPPADPGRLLLYETPLPAPTCRDRERLSIGLRSDPETAGIAVGPPVVLAASESSPPPVILVSIDTLRADAWDAGPSRPPSLQRFLEDAFQFERAYSSFPSTPQSHSVMFSGLFYAEAARRPLDRHLSWTSRLREAGYLTLGFVSGGYVRAPFGFGERAPGFALGFDLYLEGLYPIDETKAELARRHETALASEAALPTHTLGASLERSLRWFARHPDDPSFHFVHGFDVHEYRSVARRYWDAAVAGRVAKGLSPEALQLCLLKVGAEMDERLVVHHRFEAFEAVRKQAQENLDHCHRRVASLMYEARVRSAEDMLGRYLDGLRQLGVYDRALIVLTSDHGESLLDETPPGQDRPSWGHNLILANNLEVPLWIKPPASRGEGRRIHRVVGLVDLRATLEELLGLELGAGHGVSALAGEARRPNPLVFQTVGSGDWGLVLEDGALCVWRPGQTPTLMIHRDGRWSVPRARDRSRCRRGQAGRPQRVPAPEIPDELRAELRALGYGD